MGGRLFLSENLQLNIRSEKDAIKIGQNIYMVELKISQKIPRCFIVFHLRIPVHAFSIAARTKSACAAQEGLIRISDSLLDFPQEGGIFNKAILTM